MNEEVKTTIIYGSIAAVLFGVFAVFIWPLTDLYKAQQEYNMLRRATETAHGFGMFLPPSQLKQWCEHYGITEADLEPINPVELFPELREYDKGFN